MTAFKQFTRLDSAGLWRANTDAQRVNIFVSVGEASLTISDKNNRPLCHWSLAAIERSNPGEIPAVFHPNGDPDQTLELQEDARDVIEALETLRGEIDRQRAHPGRLRFLTATAFLVCIAVFLWMWLPGALRNHAMTVVPDVKRQEIGLALRGELERVTGPACAEGDSRQALDRLSARLPPQGSRGRLDVMRSGVQQAVALPGGAILLGRNLVEDYEEPDVLAGFIVAEQVRSQVHDPLGVLLEKSGLWASFQLLTTGGLPDTVLADYAELLLTAPRPAVSDDALLNGFRAWSVRATPYAYAVDITGESTLGLIEADPFALQAPPALLNDADWLRLQAICGG